MKRDKNNSYRRLDNPKDEMEIYQVYFRYKNVQSFLHFKRTTNLLVDPSDVGNVVVVELFLLEPETDFLLGGLNRVRAVGDVATDINGKVTTDGTRSRLERVGGTEDGTALLDDILALPNGGENGAGHHVLEKTREEGLLLEVSVVLTEELLRGRNELDTNKLETALLETANDGGDETTLDTIGL